MRNVPVTLCFSDRMPQLVTITKVLRVGLSVRPFFFFFFFIGPGFISAAARCPDAAAIHV